MTRHRFTHRRARQQRAKRRRLGGVFFGGLVFVVACLFLTQHTSAPLSQGRLELPKVAATKRPNPYTATPVWTNEVISGAIAVKGGGVIGERHGDQQRPIASIAKVITALVILEKYPLKHSQDLGPHVQLTAEDERLYQDYIAKNGVVFPVENGGTIRLRYALEAMLLMSANNIADTTAIWAFGSMEAYHRQANRLLHDWGLSKTIVGGDASGFDPATRSTAKELIQLGERGLDNPIFREIVAMKEFTVPGLGVFPNYNKLVVHEGYLGIKPGNTDEAGGTMLFAKQITHKGKPEILVGAVVGTKSGRTPHTSVLEATNSSAQTLRVQQP